jgi:RNA polymerase sigma-70 factor (ECF subfamily)
MTGATVSELLPLAQAGNAEAFGVLYERFALRVYRYLLARVSEPTDAEDLLQRVFLKVVEALPRYEDRGLPFGAWLFRIANNTLVDFQRTDHRTSSLEILEQRGDLVHEPARISETAEERAAVRAALDHLPPEQRDVLVYRFFAGLSPAEIAIVMGKRQGTVRVLQFRALRRLRAVGTLQAMRDDVLLGASA